MSYKNNANNDAVALKKKAPRGKPFTSETAKEAQEKSVEKRAENKEQKAIRAELADLLYQEIYDCNGIKLSVKSAVEQAEIGNPKPLIEILKLCKVPDTQKQEITGALDTGIQKVYVLPEEIKDIDKHIADTLEG